MNKPTLIAIDGGPCSGKTSGMIRISDTLVKLGMMPFIIPEAATLLINSGIAPWSFDTSAQFQKHLFLLQLENENRWIKAGSEAAGRKKKRSVFLSDRGLLSSAAYLPGNNPLENLNNLLVLEGHNVEEVRARYAGVVHMVTSADGAEEFYTLANNSARTEGLDQARILDRRTMNAWLGHPHLAVIGNKDKKGKAISFEEKMKHVVAEVLHILGFPVPIEIEDRYKLSGFNPDDLPVEYQVVLIEQHYLYTPHKEGCSERVRKRSAFGGHSYFHTIKEPALGGGRIEKERQVSADEYNVLLDHVHPECEPILKRRHCFIWENQYFEADVFGGRHDGLVILEREKTDKNSETTLPPFVFVEKEVTDDPEYSNRALARK